MSDSELNINSDKLIVGILSGTSVDSVDIVLVNIRGTGKNTSIRVIDYVQYEIDEEVRKQRLLERKMPGDSVERRLEADREDFKNFKNYNIKITNQNF